MAWPLSDVRDPMSGCFATRRDLLLEVEQGAHGFKVGLEVLTLRDGALRTAEVPILFHDRHKGESKLGGRVIRAYLTRLLALSGGRAIPPTALPAALLYGVMLSLLPLPLAWANVISGLVAWSLCYVVSRKYAADDGMSGGRRALRAVAVAVLATLLAGGLLVYPAGSWLAALIAGGIVHVGNVFFEQAYRFVEPGDEIAVYDEPGRVGGGDRGLADLFLKRPGGL